MAQLQKDEDNNIPPCITLRFKLKGHTGPIRNVNWSTDGSTLASNSEDKTIRLWNMPTGQTLRTLTGQSEIVFSVAWSPDGRAVFDLLRALHKQQGVWKPESKAGASTEERAS